MNKRGVLFFIIVAVMSYFFFSKTEKSIETNQNIEKIKIDDNYARINVSGENNKEINSIEFVLIDKSGREYLYSTNEGVNELSISGET